MTTEQREVRIFKIKNRRGYAAVCDDCLTEGGTAQEAHERMLKALRRIERKLIPQKH